MDMVHDFTADGGGVTLDGGRAAPVEMRDITPRRLSRKQKAAIVVGLLLKRGVSPGVNKLPERHQRELAHAISGLSSIDRASLHAIVREFSAAVDSLAVSFPADLSDSVNLVAPFLSEATAEALRDELIDTGDPWARVSRFDVEQLRPLMESESAEVCAVLLSKLTVAKAAALLSDMPLDRAQMLAHTMSLTETITPELVGRIGTHVAAVLSSVPPRAFGKPAGDRVGAILNSTSKDAREKMLEGLEARNAVFANLVKRAIFAFGHIPQRVHAPDVPRIMRDIEPEVAVTAFAAGMATEPLSVEFLLENMSKRLAEQLRDDAEAKGTPNTEEGEAAMAKIVAAIRTLEEAGDIKLIVPEE